MAQTIGYSIENHEPCVSQCTGCPQQMVAGKGDTHWYVCRAYLSPGAKFRGKSICPMATHLRKAKDVSRQEKKRIGQAKQQKHAGLSKKQSTAYSRIGAK